jgi:hypothetical protein
MRNKPTAADRMTEQRLQREEAVARQERGDAARETAGGLTDMWRRTYGRRSLFTNFMFPDATPDATTPQMSGAPTLGGPPGSGTSLPTAYGTLPVTMGGLPVHVKTQGTLFDRMVKQGTSR